MEDLSGLKQKVDQLEAKMLRKLKNGKGGGKDADEKLLTLRDELRTGLEEARMGREAMEAKIKLTNNVGQATSRRLTFFQVKIEDLESDMEELQSDRTPGLITHGLTVTAAFEVLAKCCQGSPRSISYSSQVLLRDLI